MPRNCLDMRNIKQPFFSYNRFDESRFDAIKKQYRQAPTIKYDDKKLVP